MNSISVGEKNREIEMAKQRVSTCEFLILSNSSQKKKRLCQSVFPTTVIGICYSVQTAFFN